MQKFFNKSFSECHSFYFSRRFVDNFSRTATFSEVEIAAGRRTRREAAGYKNLTSATALNFLTWSALRVLIDLRLWLGLTFSAFQFLAVFSVAQNG